MADNPSTSLSLHPASASEAEDNLWPDLATFQQFQPAELPVDILRAQAPFLAQRTDYWLKGFVRSSNLHDDIVYHNFYAYAPYVRQEPFKLFYLKHDVNPWAGVDLAWGDMGDLTDQVVAHVQSPDELRAKIKELLAQPALLRFLGNLIAMSRQYKLDSETDEAIDEESGSD
jgi:hypothetical protein